MKMRDNYHTDEWNRHLRVINDIHTLSWIPRWKIFDPNAALPQKSNNLFASTAFWIMHVRLQHEDYATDVSAFATGRTCNSLSPVKLRHSKSPVSQPLQADLPHPGPKGAHLLHWLHLQAKHIPLLPGGKCGPWLTLAPLFPPSCCDKCRTHRPRKAWP